jgi:hypothetical protein
VTVRLAIAEVHTHCARFVLRKRDGLLDGQTIESYDVNLLPSWVFAAEQRRISLGVPWRLYLDLPFRRGISWLWKGLWSKSGTSCHWLDVGLVTPNCRNVLPTSSPFRFGKQGQPSFTGN